MTRVFKALAVATIAASLLVTGAEIGPAQTTTQAATQAAAARAEFCKRGNNVGYLGILWTCERSGAAAVRVLSGPNTKLAMAYGGPGPCTIGDFVEIADWRITCRSVGGRATWTVTADASPGVFAVWGGAQELPGSCASGSWFHMAGRKVECASGSGSAAWKVGPVLPELVPAADAPGLCADGEAKDQLGMAWTCTLLGEFGGQSTPTWVASGTTTGASVTRQGSAGKCANGDRLVIGELSLQCRSLGSRNGWTHTWNGMRAASIGTMLHRTGKRVPGTCRKGSWIQLDGVRISCTGTAAGATTKVTKPPKPAKPAKPSTQGKGTAVVAGMTKQACLNAWWDREFAGVIPQLTRRQDAALTARIWSTCHRDFEKVMTSAERDAAYATFFGEVGTLVAAEVQRTSAQTGMTPCEAVEAVLKPRYVSGWGLTGWDESGFLPILYKQWQGGPMIGKIGGNSDDCASGRIYVQLRRHYEGRHEGPYYPALGTPAANWDLTQEEQGISWVKGATCLVWSPTFGNTAPGSAARVIGYNYTNMGDGVNMVAADNEVTKCEFKIAEAAGLPVVWKASASSKDLQEVSAAYAGIWHAMADNCSWTLQPAGGGPQVTWSPADGPYTSVQLRAGDRFASTCRMQQTEWEHMVVAPDGLMPLQALSPGPRRPSTPATCRYVVTDASALRNPPAASTLAGYGGSPVTFDVTTGGDGIGKLIRSVGCGVWELT